MTTIGAGVSVKNLRMGGCSIGSVGFSVQTIDEHCVGCNRCMRICPIETANIAYRDTNDNIKVRVDASKCILCGACIGVCKHDARLVHDDTTRFFEDLKRGAEISVIAAPSIRTNIPEWKRLFRWLRDLGVRFVYDVSLGADICIWGHLRYMRDTTKPVITQPCPVVVSYCELHKSELLPYLSPVQSPMACTAIYMRGNGISGAIASISPCVAKAHEHEATGLIQYNITFTRLHEYLRANDIRLPEEESGFDHSDACAGALFPVPGGLTENIELFLDKPPHTKRIEGSSVFRYLDQYAQTDEAHLPELFDVLNCADGCLIGTGCRKEQNVFALDRRMDEIRAQADAKVEEGRQQLEKFDRTLRLEDYLRSYHAAPQTFDDVPGDEIDRAFELLHKNDFVKRNFNCGACGSDSCHQMARKIALGVNIPSNCVILSRDEAKTERERNAEHLNLVRNIGDTMFSTQASSYEDEVRASLRRLSEATDSASVAIWRRVGDGDDLKCERFSGWYDETSAKIAILGDWPDDLLARLKEGEQILVDVEKNYASLFTSNIKTLLIVPIHLRGEFWGFVDAACLEKRTFAKEDASLLEAAGILLISGILERELNESLVTAREEALEGTRAKSDFLSRMSHEMRTPMNAIIGMTHIGKKADDLPQKDDCLEKIDNASRHLLGVINDILDISKIEADKFELSPADFDFEEMLQRVVQVIAYRTEEKRQTLTVHVDKRIPPVLRGDDQHLAQVIANLLSNAVKFTPEEGHIRLSAELAKEEGDALVIRFDVTDTGIGIREEQKERLFLSFEQAENGISRKYGGTGLGLAISKRIVELMGGNIWVESAPGKGSSFRFTIRMQRAPDKVDDAKPEAAFVAEDGCFSGYRILLAEDVEINREIVCTILDFTQVEIDWAENGRIALKKFRASPESYDLILMDLQMPEMDGHECTRQIRALDLPRARQIPIIAMTANVFREDVEKSIAAGMNDHLGKPIDYDELMKKLGKYLLDADCK
ncbi:response regulator [Synergistaceae bacterium OttesenSCG-928-I11]|nr:response regulator [Synergistaceae bacterium OttesenSCG-928-I11]